MKFKIFGDLDAPDWMMREIEILSRMSAVRIRLLLDEIVHRLSGHTIDEATDVKAIVAALSYLTRNAVKYRVRADAVSLELQQLGLPKAHANAFMRVLRKHAPALLEVEQRVDFVLASSTLEAVNAPVVQLRLTTRTPADTATHTFAADPDSLRVLLHELKAARALMDTM